MKEVYTPQPGIVKDHIRHQIIILEGAFSIGQVTDSLISAGMNPVKEYSAILRGRGPETEYRFYALDGLRGLAATGGIPQRTARLLFVSTKRISESRFAHWDEGGYYKTISALSWSGRTAPVVLKWAEERLDRQDIGDYVWLAFDAVAAVKENKTVQLTSELVNKLEAALDSEERPDRRAQLTGAVQEYRESLSPSPGG